jgi:hypothetical protein
MTLNRTLICFPNTGYSVQEMIVEFCVLFTSTVPVLSVQYLFTSIAFVQALLYNTPTQVYKVLQNLYVKEEFSFLNKLLIASSQTHKTIHLTITAMPCEQLSSRSGPEPDDPATKIFSKLGDEYRDLWKGYVKEDRKLLRSILNDPLYQGNEALHARLKLLEARYEARMLQLAYMAEPKPRRITSDGSEPKPRRITFNGSQWGWELIVFLLYVSVGISIVVYTYKTNFV